jgi:hypothetical protein
MGRRSPRQGERFLLSWAEPLERRSTGPAPAPHKRLSHFTPREDAQQFDEASPATRGKAWSERSPCTAIRNDDRNCPGHGSLRLGGGVQWQRMRDHGRSSMWR